MMVLPVVEFRKRDGAIQSRRLESDGPKTLRGRGRRWGNEVAGIVSGDYHGRGR